MSPQEIWRQPVMTYAQAIALLNERRRGGEMDEDLVLKALELTGDYDPDAEYQQLYGIKQ